MSRGNSIVCVRFPKEELSAMDEAIESMKETRPNVPNDRSLFIRQAVAAKLQHRVRSKRARSKVQIRCCSCGTLMEEVSMAEQRHNGEIDLIAKCLDCVIEDLSRTELPLSDHCGENNDQQGTT